MTSIFFEPSLNVLNYLMVKKIVYRELMLIRAGIAAHFVIPYFQIYQQPWARIAQFLNRTWDVMFNVLLASFVFLKTMSQQQGRLIVIDAVHIILTIGLLGLWIITL